MVEKYKINLDKSTKDISRGRFVSVDRGVFVRTNVVPIKDIKRPKPKVAVPSIPTLRERENPTYNNVVDAIKNSLAENDIQYFLALNNMAEQASDNTSPDAVRVSEYIIASLGVIQDNIDKEINKALSPLDKIPIVGLFVVSMDPLSKSSTNSKSTAPVTATPFLVKQPPLM